MIEPTEAHLQEACDLVNEEWGDTYWEVPYSTGNTTLRAFARYIANQQPAIAPEVVERMKKLASKVAIGAHENWPTWYFPLYREACAILAELDASQPVDPLDAVFDALPHNIGTCVDASAEFRKECAKRGLHITETHND